MTSRTVATIVALSVASTGFATVVDPKTPSTERALSLVRFLAAEDFVRVIRQFDTTMSTALPAPALQAAWQGIQAQAGAYLRPVKVAAQSQSRFEMVLVTCEFERATLDVKVIYDGTGKVAGLFFLPAGTTPMYEPPPYADPAKFTERDVEFDTGGWPLPGTLTLPVGPGPFRAAVLVHGSGPNDRDESIGPNKPFRDLAWGLATLGVAVLRYDKRTLVHGARIAQNPASLTVDDETVADAVAAVALLQKTDQIDGTQVFVVGHSLGGMLAPRIAQRLPALGGVVIMAGLTRTLEDTMLDQFTYIFESDGTITAGEQKKLDEVRAAVTAIKRLQPTSTEAGGPLLGAWPAYWLHLRSYDPATVAASLTLPILVLHGQRDYQVNDVDWQNWTVALRGRPNVQSTYYPKLNHLFFEGEGPCVPAEYERRRNVEPYVIERIAAWMLER